MRKLATLCAMFLALLGAAGCITDPVTGRTVVGAPISESAETAMGIDARPSILHEFGGEYPDPELNRQLGRIVLGMAQRSVRPDLPWTFAVLNTSAPNAFAIPGGPVFVTRGLLAQLEDEAEFAVVMGHEIGHVEHRHSVQQQGQQLLIGGGIALASAVAGDRWSAGADQGAQLLAQLGISKFSRDDERESDARGIEHSYAAGYDPRQGADVFRLFLRLKQQSGNGGGLDWLASHPADEERIESILRMSAEKDPRLAGRKAAPGLVVTTPAWDAMKSRLRSEQKVYDRHDRAMQRVAQSNTSEASVRAALAEFDACAQALPGHAAFPAVCGKARLFLGDVAGAHRDLTRAAAMNQGLAEPEYLLSELALDAKDWRSAVQHANAGLRILPGNFPCLAVRGEGNWQLGRRDEATRDFQAVVQSAPKDSEAYRLASSRLGGSAAPAPARTKPRRRAR